MNAKDLLFIFDTSIKKFVAQPSIVKLNGDKDILVHQERVALAYYESVMLYLIKTKALPQDFDCGLDFIEENSDVNEDDYI
jgi:hypothetical protein